jgi:hypothetical protein
VHIFSLEMTADDLLTINLASVTQYSADDIRSGTSAGDATPRRPQARHGRSSRLTPLTVAEHGGYLLLLMHAWTKEGELPADDQRLRTIAKMDVREWKRSGPTLMGFSSATATPGGTSGST